MNSHCSPLSNIFPEVSAQAQLYEIQLTGMHAAVTFICERMGISLRSSVNYTRDIFSLLNIQQSTVSGIVTRISYWGFGAEYTNKTIEFVQVSEVLIPADLQTSSGLEGSGLEL